ncbi:CHAT domain-containing protein [Kribbella sp. NPDC051936]|uniref:CHAT domain-containing protein n=1 Tax=Kribbella sp. NPDC051936 TaxID=3154946 RepID=UPI00341E208D
MRRYQFEVRVSATQVAGIYSTPEATDILIDPDPIEVDQLRDDTIDLLEDLLNNWDVLGRLMTNPNKPSLDRSRQSLLTARTFRVLGTHLWDMILAGTHVGPALMQAIDQDRKGRTLRVLISFDGADAEVLRLMGLPWEFLFCPHGYFLSARSELVLSRFVRTGEQQELEPTAKPLNVRFVLALPEGAGFGDEYRKVVRMIDGVRAIDQVEVAIDDWPPRTAVVSEGSVPNGAPPDVIHLVGACLGERGKAKIFYGVEDQPPTWQPPDVLIDALVELSGREASNGSRAGTKLVVLHLCEWTGDQSDPSENFERLAPNFIDRGIPAVLAMQYPLAAAAAQGPLRTFYEQLASGKAVGQSVQFARSEMRKKDQNMRWFGAPVLYLRCADGPVRQPEKSSIGPLNGPEFALDSPIRGQLIEIVRTSDLTADQRQRLVDWVDEVASNELNLERILRAQLKKHADDFSMFGIFNSMLKAVTGDVRRTG